MGNNYEELFNFKTLKNTIQNKFDIDDCEKL